MPLLLLLLCRREFDSWPFIGLQTLCCRCRCSCYCFATNATPATVCCCSAVLYASGTWPCESYPLQARDSKIIAQPMRPSSPCSRCRSLGFRPQMWAMVVAWAQRVPQCSAACSAQLGRAAAPHMKGRHASLSARNCMMYVCMYARTHACLDV